MIHNELFFLGIDLGGSNTDIGIVSAEGELEEYLSLPTEIGKGPEYTVDMIVNAAKDLITGFRADVSLAGLGAPGPLDTNTGVVFEMPNFGWNDVPLGSMIEKGLGIKTYLDNDANAAAFGEWWVGAGVGARVLVCFTLGTGVGGGIVVNGDVHRGVSDAAAEFGHIVVEPEGRVCNCGKSGCLEAYASATAISAQAVEKAKAGEAEILLGLADGEVSKITSELVSRAALEGDVAALEVIEKAAKYLAIGISNVMNVLNPDVIVIGGGVVGAGDMLLKPLRRLVSELTFDVLDSSARIVTAELGRKAGTVGAAGIAKRRGENP
jgi:glucokinase